MPKGGRITIFQRGKGPRKGYTMAYQRKQNNTETKTTRKVEPLKVTECVVTRAHRFENGGEVFDLRLNGITIYGCRLVDGKNGTFVSFPSRKGNDGKYYAHAFALLDDKTIEDICGQVAGLLDK